ncbi:MAG: hypothetical protein KBA71_15110 [Opitutaceae bacterium]|nr:hypothetical protein [Opitutaceae bacterium]
MAASLRASTHSHSQATEEPHGNGAIWRYAEASACVIVTKDEDFCLARADDRNRPVRLMAACGQHVQCRPAGLVRATSAADRGLAHPRRAAGGNPVAASLFGR